MLKEIKRIKHTEERKVNDVLHKISRAIVNEAREKNAVIVLGNLKGIRKSAKGKADASTGLSAICLTTN